MARCRAWKPLVNSISMGTPGEDKNKWGLCRNKAVYGKMCQSCMEALAQIDDPDVRSMVVDYESTPREILTLLASDPDVLVSRTAQRRLG